MTQYISAPCLNTLKLGELAALMILAERGKIDLDPAEVKAAMLALAGYEAMVKAYANISLEMDAQ